MEQNSKKEIKLELATDKLPPKKGLTKRDEEKKGDKHELALPLGVELASYGRRGGALVIDFVYGRILFSIPYFFSSHLEKYYLLFLEQMKINQVLPPEQLHNVLHLGAGLILFLLFYMVPVVRMKRTWGKRCLGLWVGDSHGELIGGTRAFFRELIKAVSVLSVLGVFVVFLNVRRQSIHDYFFRTIVYK